MKRSLLLCTLGVAMLCAGCAQNQWSLEHLRTVGHHDLIFRGRIVKLSTAPGYWSGFLVATQEVTYDVLEVYKGDVPSPGQQIVVEHVLLGNHITEDAEARLDPSVMRPGREVIIFAATKLAHEKGAFVFGDDPTAVLFVAGERLTPHPPALPKQPHRYVHVSVVCPGSSAGTIERSFAVSLRWDAPCALPELKALTTIAGSEQLDVYLSLPWRGDAGTLTQHVEQAIPRMLEGTPDVEKPTVSILKPGEEVPNVRLTKTRTVHLELDQEATDRLGLTFFETSDLEEDLPYVRVPEGDFDQSDLDALRAETLRLKDRRLRLHDVATLQIVTEPRPIIRTWP